MVNRLIYQNMPRKVIFTVDHILPLGYGSDSPHNLVLACASCNPSKRDKVIFIEWQPPNMLSWMRNHVDQALEIKND